MMIYIILIGILLDQTSKMFAKRLKGLPMKYIGPFRIKYVENRGAALGFLKNKRFILLTGTSLLIGLVSYLLYEAIANQEPKLFQVALSLVLGGGYSNTLDRFIRKYVIDFYSFKLKKLPFFNIADLLIIIGSIMMLISGLIFDVSI